MSRADVNLAEVESAELVLPNAYFGQMRDHLLSDCSREYIGHVLCGYALLGKTLRLLGCYTAYPMEEDYRSRGPAYLELRSEYDLAMRQECVKQRLSLVDFHSHPFADYAVSFSGIDDADEFEKSAYFRRNMPGCIYGSVVMARARHVGRVFAQGPHDSRPRIIPLRIRSLDIPVNAGPNRLPSPGPLPVKLDFDRQVRAFGSSRQEQLSRVRVAIVGLGGIGGLLADGLARLGIQHFVLIDRDQAEPSNLHRVSGMTAKDAEARRYKVNIARRQIRAVHPGATVEVCRKSVFEPSAWERLRDVDMIIAATDNDASRMLLNALSFQYLIPLVAIGTLITVGKDGEFEGYGDVFTVLPGQHEPCLLCSKFINIAEAYYELGPAENRRAAAERGYIQGFDEPDPAVYHLNKAVAALAEIEIHNIFCDFKPRKVHLLYQMSTQRLLTMEYSRQSCSVCSPDGYHFARGDDVDPVEHLFPLPDAESTGGTGAAANRGRSR